MTFKRTFSDKRNGRPPAPKMMLWREMDEAKEKFRAIRRHSPKAAEVLIKDLQRINLETVK